MTTPPADPWSELRKAAERANVFDGLEPHAADILALLAERDRLQQERDAAYADCMMLEARLEVGEPTKRAEAALRKSEAERNELKAESDDYYRGMKEAEAALRKSEERAGRLAEILTRLTDSAALATQVPFPLVEQARAAITNEANDDPA